MSFASLVKETQKLPISVGDKNCGATILAKPLTIDKEMIRMDNIEVKRGGSGSGCEIQGTECKKFLHVYRFEIDTTVECLEKHVKKSYCGFIQSNGITNSSSHCLDLVLSTKYEGSVCVKAAAPLVPPDPYHPALEVKVRLGLSFPTLSGVRRRIVAVLLNRSDQHNGILIR
ncbi:unnamed protein product [Euphydryas editha]|uniref:Uncharacterized protein n=1 Tax=Euphydryas editha TaxID=104508 RepID=A0AAU9UPK7_EUPED|nr:unnamed protein product [Euphydryas editha]